LEGNRYRHAFSSPEAHNETRITSLCQDNDLFLWIGTADQGLFRLDTSTHAYTLFRYNESDEESLPSNRITRIYKDQTHRLWVSTEDAGLCQFNFQTGKFTRYTPDSPPSRRLPTLKIGPIVADRSGNLFIGSQSHGLFCLPVKRQEFVPLTSGDDALFSNLSINSLFVDERDILWIGTKEKGLYYLDGPWSNERRIKFFQLSPQPFLSPGLRLEITAFHESPYTQNHLWIGTNKGLFLYKRETGRILHAYNTRHSDSINGNSVLALMEDKGGTLWIGIDSGKFDRVDLRSQFFVTHKAGESLDSLKQNHLTAICQLSQEPPRLLLGDKDGSLTIASLQTDRSVSFRSGESALPCEISQFARLSPTAPGIVIRTRDGRLWRYSQSSGSITPLHPQGTDSAALCITPSPFENAILLGNAKGLHLYYPDRRDPTDIESYPGCRDLNVQLLQSDYQGGLYLVTDKGLYHMADLDLTTKPTSYAFDKRLSQLPKPEINTILCRYNGHVLLGTSRHGLLRVNGLSVEPIETQFPLQSPTSPVKALFEDDLLQLWVCTGEGLYTLASTSKTYDEWTLFGEQHQIPLPLTGAGLIEPTTNQLLLTSAGGLLQVNLRDLILPIPCSRPPWPPSPPKPATGFT